MIRTTARTAAFLLLVCASTAWAQPVVIDDFEVDEGHFNQDPSASGSIRNIHPSSTADRTELVGYQSYGWERLNIVALKPGEVQANGTGFNPAEGWRTRFLSGAGGSPANNVNIGPDGYVGYFARTTTPGLQAGIILDDLPGPVGTAGDHELSAYQDITADGRWHLYQFNLDDPAIWTRFAGTATGAGIDGSNVSIDSVVLRYPGLENRPDATIGLDNVAFNPTGTLDSLVLAPEYLIADANSDGKVSVGDLGILATKFNTNTRDGRPGADFNYDGVVSVGDLGILATYFGQPSAGAGISFSDALKAYPNLAAAVPEPASLVAILTGAPLLARRRRR